MNTAPWKSILTIYSLAVTVVAVLLSVFLIRRLGQEQTTAEKNPSVGIFTTTPSVTASITTSPAQASLSFPSDITDAENFVMETLFYEPEIWKKATEPPWLLNNLILSECTIRSRFVSSGFFHAYEWMESFAGISWRAHESSLGPGSFLREYRSGKAFLTVSFVHSAGLEFGDNQTLYRWRQCTSMAMVVFRTLQISGSAGVSAAAPEITSTPRKFGQCAGAPASLIWTGDSIYILRDTPLKANPLSTEVIGYLSLKINDQGFHELFTVEDGPVCISAGNETAAYWLLSQYDQEGTAHILGWAPEADSGGRYLELFML